MLMTEIDGQDLDRLELALQAVEYERCTSPQHEQH